jgi:allantoinase
VAAADGLALIDYGLWGGIVPGNVEELAELHARGAVGFKAFMCATGVPEFPRSDDLTLYEGMARAAQLGAPVAVHAENEAIATGLRARACAEGRRGVRDYLASRPVVCEVEAMGRAITLAEHTGCSLHIVHVSTGAGVALVVEARARGVDVSCETCPHYLVLTDEDVERLGAIAKCSPPIRDAGEQRALWRALAAGTLPMVASDHSPSPPSLKQDAPDFDGAWGGISGCQSMLEIVLSEGHHRRGLPLERIARATSEFAARRFGLLDKGRIAPGSDADLTIVDLDAEHTQAAADLHYRHPQSPFLGLRLRGRVVCAIVRGVTVAERGEIVARPQGRLVRPRGRAVAEISASAA